MNRSLISQAKKSSKKARLSAARLAAVQAVYQMHENEQKAASVIEEFKARHFGQSLEGDEMVLPDGVLFEAVVKGVEERRSDLDEVISGASDQKQFEALLQSILLCGSFELLAHHDVDSPVIISDYLNVTHAFYEGGESKLINGILDRLSGNLRDGSTAD